MDRDRIVEESREWVEDGIISRAQREDIISRYEPEDSILQGRAMKAFAAFGGILSLIGILGLLGVYWADLESIGQLVILYGGSAVFLSSAYYLRERLDYRKLTTSLVFSGLILFIYGLIHTHTVIDPGFTELHMLLPGSLLAAPVAWFFRSRLSMLIPVFGIALWLTTGLEKTFLDSPPLILLFYGVILYSISHLISQFRELLLWTGAFFIFLVLFFFTLDITSIADVDANIVLGLVAGAATLLGVESVYRGFKEKNNYDAVWLGAVILTGFYLLVLAVVGSIDDYELLFWCIHNILTVGLIIGIGVAAFQRRQKGLLNIGILFFVLQLSFIYYDMLFDALGFVALLIGGILLVIGSIIIERERRELTKNWSR